MEILLQLFPGIGTFFEMDPLVSVARVALIILGFFLAYFGFKRTLEPLIMVPMGISMMAVNAGIMFLNSGAIGNMFVDPLASDAVEIVNIMQVNFLQPIYNLTFSNGLIACLVFMGIGARSEISYLLAKPWSSMIIAIFAELGTFVTLVAGVMAFGLPPGSAAAVASIGGADGPMVLFTSLMLAPELFVPISIIAYLYLSLTYGGYPFLIKLFIPKKYRGIDMYVDVPQVSQRSKFVFIVVSCFILCLLLPVASPLIFSFFIGMAVKEAEIGKYTELLEEGLSYFATFFLGVVLGVLCEASTILNPTVLTILILGIMALAVSAIGGLLGGWVMYWWHKHRGLDFNPVIGIAGVSCVPTTAKLAQHAAMDENPFAMILPVAMGANISGVFTSAIAAGIFVSTIHLIG
ncbi:oxaloacetate decarboxylase, beta subunit [Oscillibacter sp. PC13]|uniref:Na+-transporting malonate decarboxylase, carboxybiotin decarboxylase subunit n=1 Tax=Oscillibacter sp. PC13 TaxID=1855299 RepID=UPI0008EAF418|nr:Na+-transporting malonate decarboxylase, carboxybiotin decarboxylase subunit [Oscillibacter sp. PC13]SFP28863.1 oxaloacetate decarboxylase, beta subunit [Oscillibacter sp. PC13]